MVEVVYSSCVAREIWAAAIVNEAERNFIDDGFQSLKVKLVADTKVLVAVSRSLYF